MSHFSVAVFTDGAKTVEELLAPYDENIEMPVYVKETKEQIIKRIREEIKEYAEHGYYAEWKSDPEKYETECTNEQHIEYLKNKFPKMLSWTDEECYQSEIRWCEENELDESGSILSTYNPESKWDWYSIGGRWNSKLPASKGLHGEGGLLTPNQYERGMYDVAKVKDIKFPEDFTTFAVVLPDGTWYEKGQMGWWATVSNEDDDWDKHYKERFIDTAKPEWTLTIVDCHI